MDTCKCAAEDEFVVRKRIFSHAGFSDFEFRGVNVGQLGHGGLVGWCLG